MRERCIASCLEDRIRKRPAASRRSGTSHMPRRCVSFRGGPSQHCAQTTAVQAAPCSLHTSDPWPALLLLAAGEGKVRHRCGSGLIDVQTQAVHNCVCLLSAAFKTRLGHRSSETAGRRSRCLPFQMRQDSPAICSKEALSMRPST